MAEGLSAIKLHPPSKLSVYTCMERLLSSTPGHGQACVQMSRKLQAIGRLVEGCDRQEVAAVLGELSSQVIIVCGCACTRLRSLQNRLFSGVQKK